MYRARDTLLHRDVALKILRDEFAGDRNRMERFHREAELLAALNHHNIAMIYGLHRDDTATALVLELVEGETLADRIRGGRLPMQEVRTIGQQIARALAAAHARGIVHRDLKPGNVKIRPDGTVKVLDFGLACIADSAVVEHDITDLPTVAVDLTHVGNVMGTVPYMSPEQLVGQRVDQRTDIWAFGCVLFEMMSGRRAFRGATTSAVVSAIVAGSPDSPSLSGIPRSVRGLVRQCLERDVDRRPNDIARLGDALTGARTYRRLVVGAGVVGTAAAVLVATAFGGLWPREPLPPPAAPESQRSRPPVDDRDRAVLTERIAEARTAEQRAREGPSSAELIAASRDELIAVLEVRATRIVAWMDAEKGVADALSARMGRNTGATGGPAGTATAAAMERVKREFMALHERHIAALRAGQLVVAHEVAAEIVHLLVVFEVVLDPLAAAFPATSYGRAEFDVLKRPVAPVPARGELYPALENPPVTDGRTIERIAARLNLGLR